MKIYWKAWTPSIYEALTGVDGARAQERLRENARLLSRLARERPDPTLLVVSVLLVPGYVGPGEVYGVARFLASLDPTPPMVLPPGLPPRLPHARPAHDERRPRG